MTITNQADFHTITSKSARINFEIFSKNDKTNEIFTAKANKTITTEAKSMSQGRERGEENREREKKKPPHK